LIAYTDTHCHLNLNTFQNDLPAVIDRARQAGIDRILVPGIDLETSLRAVEIADRYPEVYAAVGVHPNEADAWGSQVHDQLEHLCNHPKVAAIGEIGLDFYRNPETRDKQFEILDSQLEISRKFGKPVVLHSRHAMTTLWEIMQHWHDWLIAQKSDLTWHPGVFHAYEGDMPAAREIGKRGFLIGVGGPITYKNSQERNSILMELPVDFLVSETDAPFLTPLPHRGERNEPAHIPLIVAKTAELHKMTVTETALKMNANADNLFNWRTPA
jgi:TatD DNase family protein